MNRRLSFSWAVLLAVLWLGSRPALAGSIGRLVYDDITGSTVATLTNATIFPDGPTFREQLDDFTPAPSGALAAGLQAKDTQGNNYGSLIRGYLEAPASGSYVFFVASDDASEFWLSTDVSTANRQRIAFESTGGAPLFSGERLSERRSVPINLVRGQKYYLEILHKQGTGSSFVKAGWQRPDGVQEIIPTRHLYQFPVDPYLGSSDPNLPPTFNSYGLNGGDLPSVIAVNEGADLTLELDVVAAQPVTIEWRRGGVVIPAENLSFLKLSDVPAALDGVAIEASVVNAYGTLKTTTARLAVTPDAIPPAFVSVDPRGNPNRLRVNYSEAVTGTTAINLANYRLQAPGGAVIPILSATLSDDGTFVDLSGIFNFAVNGTYTLTVQDINDRATTPNRLSPNPTSQSFAFAGPFLGAIGFDAAHPLHDLTVLENRTARFEAVLTGAKPWFYQWSQDGTPIPGATNSVLEVAQAGGLQVAVSNEFSSALSPVVHLTVSPDTNAAQLVAIRGLAGVNTVTLGFDEVLDATSVTNIANYTVGSVPILNAALSADGRTITLSTGPLLRDEVYLVSVIGVKDMAAARNSFAGSASFVAQVDYVGEVLADHPVRYWRFDETNGTTAASLATGLDPLSGGIVTLENGPATGVPSLVPSLPDDLAIELAAIGSQRVLVPNGSDLNATAGPWSKKSFEFWFKANSTPVPDTTGLAATAGIWEQGAATRSIAAYLWRDPTKPNPNEAELVFHAFNNASDGPGSPFGLTMAPAVFVQHTVSVGQAYHVVAVFDGDVIGVTGHLILYVDGVEVGRAGGVGQIYNHTGDVQIGRGNGVIHTGENGDFGFFDGVLDEVSAYNTALDAARVAAHFQAGQGGSGGGGSALGIRRVETRGNSNLVLATFTKPVSGSSAEIVGHYTITTASGAVLPISNAKLLPGGLTVQLTGVFNFPVGTTNTLVARDITDQEVSANLITPNPTTASFVIGPSGLVGIGPGSELGNRVALENQIVRFTVEATGTPPFCYQWFRDGVSLDGQNTPEMLLTATSATVGDYSVKVANDFSQLTTTPSKLSLNIDLTPPRVLSLRALAGSLNEVRLVFDEPVNLATATNLATYQIASATVLSATVDPTGTGVTLHTSALTNAQAYVLTIAGLKDIATAGNILNTQVTFNAATSYADEVLADHPVRYWRFEETNGTKAPTLTASLDVLGTSAATYVNSPQLGVPGLVPNLVDSFAVDLTATNSQRLTVPNGSDLNANVGPWAKKTIQFWFRAASVPAPDKTGLAATAGLWEQGAASRSIAVYLWRDPANPNPDEAALVFNALNNVATDGVGAPYGPPGGPAIFVQHTVRVGETYHVVAVFDGDATGLTGNLILYVNGVEAGRAPGIGRIFNHTGDVQIGRGNGLIHLNINGDFGFFDGVIDEVSVYNTALSGARVSQLYQAALSIPPASSNTDSKITDARIVSGQIVITWEGPGRLGASTSVSGPFDPVGDTANPHSEPVAISGQRYFKIIPQ